MKASIKSKLRKALPLGIYKVLSKTYSEIHWYTDARAKRSHIIFRKLKNSHKGQRCFIIGNGPSLKKMDLSVLRDEVTFGLNRINLLFPKIGFTTTYYVAVNGLVVKQCAEEIENINSVKFINWSCRRYFNTAASVYYINDPSGGGVFDFSKNPTRRTYCDSTVTFAALQLAFWFGFDKVILIGVDHNFSTKGENDKEIISQGDDPNHFDPSYFGKGFRWQLPNLSRSEKAYKLAKLEFEKNGREILDATVGGKLDIFEKVSYDSLFGL